MTYVELTAKLIAIEQATGLYLSDTCVDGENATDPDDDASLFVAALAAAAFRAEDAGLDINVLMGEIVW